METDSLLFAIQLLVAGVIASAVFTAIGVLVYEAMNGFDSE